MTDTVQEMMQVVENVLGNQELSQKVVREILDYFGGMQIYLPKIENTFREEINQKIYQAFNGHNHKAVIRAYSISIQRLYEIIRTQRKIKEEEINLKF